MRTILSTVVVSLALSFSVSAIAEDAVVVIPVSGDKAGGTTGQVQYNDEGKNAGAEVYYDKGTGNVGIGVVSPTESIEVNGSVKANSFIGDGGSLTGITTGNSGIVHITWTAPNAGSSCLNCFGVKMKGAGKILEVQAWSTSNVGNDWWADVNKNGTSVLVTRPNFANQTVTSGVVKTDGTEIFAEGDTLAFSTVEDTNNPNPVYPAITVIVQYD